MNPYRIVVFLLLPVVSLAQTSNTEAWNLILTAEQHYGKTALPALTQAQNICRSGCADTTMARLYRRLGVAYFQDAIDDNQALSFTDTALVYYLRAYSENHPQVINCRYNRSLILPYLGRVDEAINALLRAIDGVQLSTEFSSQAAQDSVLAGYYVDLASDYTQIGDYFQADLYSKAGLLAADKRWPGNHPVKALLHQNLGYQSFLQRDYSDALEQYQAALSNNQDAAGMFVSATEDIREKIGLSYLYLKRFEQAEEQFRIIRSSYKQQLRNQEDMQAYLQGKLAYVAANFMLLHLKRKDWRNAHIAFEQAMNYTNAAYEGRSTIKASLLFQRAQLADGEGDKEGALSFSAQALEELTGAENLRTVEVVLSETPYQLLDIIAFQARLLEELDRPQEAIQRYLDFDYWVHHSRQRFRTAFSKIYLLRSAKPTYEKAIDLSLQLYRSGEGRQWLEQAFAFNAANKGAVLREELQHVEAIRYGGVPGTLLEQEENQRQSLARLQSQLANAEGDLADSLLALSQQETLEYDALLRRIAVDFPEYYELKFRSDFTVDIPSLQASLQEGQALVEYFLGEDKLYTFVLMPHNSEVLEKKLPADWDDSFQLYHFFLGKSIEAGCERQFMDLSHSFYRLTFEDVEHILPAETRRLIIVPDGLLKQLPFEALQTKGLAQLNGVEGFLLEKYAISYRYTSRTLPQEGSERQAAGQLFGGFGLEYEPAELEKLAALGFGDKKPVELPVLPECRGLALSMRGLGALKYSDDEVRNITDLIGGDSWLNEEATKSNFLRRAASYQLLHLAMHSVIDTKEPLNSALIFKSLNEEDFLLRAVQIYEMQLNGELAVLSACHTGTGASVDGGSPMSLSRAFHYAGIPSVVASLWALPDFSAAGIMPLFYENLKAGMAKDVALQQAKLTYLMEDDYSSPMSRAPVFWAAPVLVGDAREVLIGGWSQDWHIWLLVLSFIVMLFLFLRWRSKRN